MLIRRLFAAVEPTFLKQHQSNVDIRLSTSQPFFNQISTLKQRRVPGGLYLYKIIILKLNKLYLYKL
jgi:hypothetical protein